MIEGDTIDEVKRAIDRLVYPKLLLHARVVVYRRRTIRARMLFLLQRLTRGTIVAAGSPVRVLIRTLRRTVGPIFTSLLKPAVQRDGAKRTQLDEYARVYRPVIYGSGAYTVNRA